MTDKICPFMSHVDGHGPVYCYGAGRAAWKEPYPHSYRTAIAPGGYCMRIWGPPE